eukprot:COSAG06_NODE_1267_length_10059_cov_181.325201_4_plen_353_part_00
MSAMRTELEGLTAKKLINRAEAMGIPEDEIEEADEASDRKAALIALITSHAARAPAAGGADDPDGGSLVRLSSKQINLARAQKAEEAAAQMAAENAQREAEFAQQLQQMKDAHEQQMRATKAQQEEKERAAKAARDVGPKEPNIKERLDMNEWDESTLPEGMSESWWGTGKGDDRSLEVNRLRTLAKVRVAWPENTFDKWPTLVVVGDGNTGKSTVLNRFAQFNFSAVSDGICTKRPVRLKLRPMSNKNRYTFATEKLHAMVHLHDTRDGFRKDYKFRISHRFGNPDIPRGEVPDEDELRYEVEERAAMTPPERTRWEKTRRGEMTAEEKHDATCKSRLQCPLALGQHVLCL